MHLPRWNPSFGGVSGNADEAVKRITRRKILAYNPNVHSITMIMKQVTAVAIMAAEVIPAINI